MKLIGIGIFWFGAICVAFHFHILLGLGALVWSLAIWWQFYTQHKQRRRTFGPGAGLDYPP